MFRPVAAALMPVLAATAASPADTPKASFADGAWSTGWIDFDDQGGKRIFIPARINGHAVEVQLATGLPVSDIDRNFSASLGLQADASGLVHGLDIQIGALSLRDTAAAAVDFGPLSRHIGHPLPFLLGDAVFDRLAVDIDFAHHRIAFSDPAHQDKPDGAIEIPLRRAEDLPLVPVSIEGAPPALFEMGLGNSGELLVYQSYYDAHKLLDGRRLSRRLAAGTGGIIAEPVGTLHQAGFAGFDFADMPAAFIPASLAGTRSDLIAGDLGLPVLARFRLVVDYSHGRLYAAPYQGAMRAPFAKDRLGLWLDKTDAGLAVEFVAPGSPAAAAGFKAGDRIASIDGKPAAAWPEASLADLRYGAARASLRFAMPDGAVRRVKLADYF